MALDNERAPQAGDVVVTPRAMYRVTGARLMDSAVWDNRWLLDVHRIGDARNGKPLGLVSLESDCIIHRTTKYGKGESPAEFFGRQVEA